MSTNSERDERITRLEVRLENANDHIAGLRIQVIGLAFVVLGIVVWLAGQGFTLGDIPGSPV